MPRNKKSITFRGVEYESVADFARAFKLSGDTARGWAGRDDFESKAEAFLASKEYQTIVAMREVSFELNGVKCRSANAFAKHLGMPKQTMYNWVHDYIKLSPDIAFVPWLFQTHVIDYEGKFLYILEDFYRLVGSNAAEWSRWKESYAKYLTGNLTKDANTFANWIKQGRPGFIVSNQSLRIDETEDDQIEFMKFRLMSKSDKIVFLGVNERQIRLILDTHEPLAIDDVYQADCAAELIKLAHVDELDALFWVVKYNKSWKESVLLASKTLSLN